MGRYQREISVAAAYGALLALLAVCAPRFFQGDKLWSILVSSAPLLVVALGMTLVILTRQIDISVGSQFSMCSIVLGLLVQNGVPLPIAAGLTLLAGASLGAINGLFIAGLNLPSIVVTLATMVSFREALRWQREGELVRNLPEGFQWFGLSQLSGQIVIVAIALILFAVFAWGLMYSTAGRMVYATGSDLEAARLAGIRPRGVVGGVFVMMGLLTACGAILGAVQLSDVDPNAGMGLELQVIAAVVIGGVSVAGGRGTAWGTLGGVLLLATIPSALVFLGTDAYWEKALQGTIILLAVASDAFSHRREDGR